MTDLQLRIFARAAAVRVARGEQLAHVLASWPALTDDDRARVREHMEGSKGGGAVA